MSKVIRLSGADQRRWNSHASVVVGAGGDPLRVLGPREVDVMFQLGRFVREKRQSARAKIPGTEITIEARLEKLEGSTAQEARFYVDGLRIEDMREVMSREFLQKHGECQLRMTNGKFLAVIRDPSKERSTPADAQRTSPRPENCVCRDWGSAHPGKHHAICEHNQKAPPEERGESAVSDKDIELIGAGIEPKGPPVPISKMPIVEERSAQVMPDPDKCVCSTWQREEGAPGSGHHPICEWRDPWESRSRKEEFLSDVATGERVRAATQAEVEEADENEKRTGSRMIAIGDKSYAVVPAE